MKELTELLHLAYGELAKMGLRFYASHQSEDVTQERASMGECYVGEKDGKLVCTVTLTDAENVSGSPWYDRPDVFTVNQFAVHPDLQRQGIGSAIMDFIERRAAQKGVVELGLDTSESATHLINFYKKRGYRFIEYVKWEAVNYRSMVFSKTLVTPVL
jgi:ribosomal protein S18 acetylase RimI-like enzyme